MAKTMKKGCAWPNFGTPYHGRLYIIFDNNCQKETQLNNGNT